MRFILPTLLGLASLASLVPAADVNSHTECHPRWGNRKTTHWCSSTTTTHCPWASTSTVTETTTIRDRPVKTVTVSKTTLITAPATTTIMTATVRTTTPTTTTTTTTSVSSVTATVTASKTSYSNVGAAPQKRDLHHRKGREVHCTNWQWHCTPAVSTTTKTLTHTGATSTKTVTHTISVTTTPAATSISTTTKTSTSTATATSTAISITTIATTTTTVTVTSTYASFYIAASSDTATADGTTLDNVPDGNSGEGVGRFNGGNTVFALDPSTGQLYDTATTEIANVETGITNSVIFFDTQADITSGSHAPCDCGIDESTLILSCDCAGDTIFQTSSGYLYIGDSLEYDAVTPVVQPILI